MWHPRHDWSPPDSRKKLWGTSPTVISEQKLATRKAGKLTQSIARAHARHGHTHPKDEFVRNLSSKETTTRSEMHTREPTLYDGWEWSPVRDPKRSISQYDRFNGKYSIKPPFEPIRKKLLKYVSWPISIVDRGGSTWELQNDSSCSRSKMVAYSDQRFEKFKSVWPAGRSRNDVKQQAKDGSLRKEIQRVRSYSLNRRIKKSTYIPNCLMWRNKKANLSR